MSFNTAITGLKAASTMLDVTGNNIANVSTTGFKTSRTQFADLYSTAVVGAGSSNTPGSGVTVSGISQDFSAGTIEFTNNNLDLAINGSGFFQLSDGQGGVSYTRAGAFELNKDGMIVSKNGKYLQGYGLDDMGNRLPIGNLAVTQKESPPKATESISLSVNIDARADSSLLLPTYNKDEPGSFTYTTTVRTFDSLGNEHTIKYNFAEQRPVREVYTFDFSTTPAPQTVTVGGNTYTIFEDGPDRFAELDGVYYSFDPVTGDIGTAIVALDLDPATSTGTYTYNDTLVEYDLYEIDGVTYAREQGNPAADYFEVDINDPDWAAGDYNPETSAIPSADYDVSQVVPPVVISGVTISNPLAVSTAEREQLAAADPRIDVSTIDFDVANGALRFELQARATDQGDMSVSQAGTRLTRTNSNDPYRPANEVRTYLIDIGTTDPADLEGNLNVGGVNINISGMNNRMIAEAIQGREAEILDLNPSMEQVSIVQDGTAYSIQITFKADEGDIRDDRFQPQVTLDAGELIFGDATFDAGIPGAASGVVNPSEIVEGDNTYRGNYRVYAYLNGEELLNMGKLIDPGFPGGGSETQVGPIMIQFDPTNGLLRSINGQTFPAGGQVPAITIRGADPANPVTTITMRLDNTTQFASASIVKNQQQDGYTKGDLIGVTFAPTGEMIASFSNGQNQALGVVAFATFENQDGLQPSGDTEWIATLASGNAILNPPGTGLNGTLRSAALEQSNVDLSTELVNLIQAQRNFQASSKTLETANNITQTILNI